MKYRSEIDGLRALAIVPVILFHAGFQAFGGGFVGVDVFFVISGYLITTILLADMQAGNFSIVHFYERRVRRILPALFVVMFASLLLAWLWLLPRDMKEFSESLVAASAFGANVFFWQASGYFDTATKFQILMHTWSLSVEEQYYVVFPVLLFLAWKLGRRGIAALLLVVAVSSFLLAHYTSTRHPVFDFYWLPTRAWELMAGALVAVYYTDHNIRKHKHAHSEAGSLLGFALIVYSVFAYDRHTPFPGIYALAPVTGAALIIVFTTRETLVAKVLGSRYLVGIGLVSYSAYLWHQPLFAFARRYFLVEPGDVLMSALALLSFALAYLTWRFVERPFRNRHRFTRRQVFLFGAAGSALFIATGLAGYVSNGFEERLPAAHQDIRVFGKADVFAGSRRSDGSCSRLLGLPQISEEVCLASSSTPRFLFAGDSHAMALFSSVFAKDIKLDGVLVSGHSCPPYPNLSYTATHERSWGNNCTAIANEMLRVARQLKSVDTVLLVNYFSRVDDEKSRYWIHGVNLTKRQAFESGYDALIGDLLKLGKHVVFVVDVPQLKYERASCFQALSEMKHEDCRYSTKENEAIRRAYLREVKKLKSRFPSVVIYDPTPLFCRGAECEYMSGGKSLYNDRDHLSVFGSRLVMQDLMQRGIISGQ